MIFSHTYDLLLSGRKTQTCRLAYAGDFLKDNCVFTADARRVRWEVGSTYAIQPERCHAALGRFRCTYLREVINPTVVDDAFVNAEGFDSREEYLRVWFRLHGKHPVQRCWAIGMELLAPPAGRAAVEGLGGGK